MSPLDALVGSSPSMVALRAQIERLLARPGAAGRLPPILVLGETGTGKGLLVRLVHQASARRDMPLVEINCAAIPENLLEAELFGYEKGAFTDARQGKPGLFQAAHRGVLFLDEVGALPRAAQAKLLTALEQRQVRRLGSTRVEPVDTWVFSATNQDLAGEAARHEFRLDLYHRLSAVTLSMPSLRDRGRDVLALARHYLGRAAADYGLPARQLTRAAEEALLAYAWPGNVRELANLMERTVLLGDAEEISAEQLDLPSPSPRREPASAPRGEADPDDLRAALDAVGWNLSRAAARLGVPRNTLRYRIERLGLKPGAAPAPRAAEARATAPTDPARLRWERRWVTGLSIRLDPPAAISGFRLAPLLEDVLRKVESFGGRAEDLHPLGLTALFGQEPAEDAPARAALAAQAVQKTVEAAAIDGQPVAVRLALHAVQGLVARGAGAGGMAVEDRARLREGLAALDSAAAAGIAVGADAARFLDRRFALEALRSAERAAPAYRLVGPSRSGFDLPDGGRSPFFGREREIAQLDDLLAEAERGRGQLVGLVGEPGVGKSRLLYEFRESLGRDRVTSFEGRGTPHGLHTPYGPIAQLLRQAFGFGEADDAAIVSRRVREGVDALGLDAPSPAPYLLNLLGVRDDSGELAALSPQAVRQRTLEALRRTMIAASQLRPVILAIEDLQWVDATSAESLTALAESAAAARILMITTYRPGHRPPWLGRAYATQLVVRRLTAEDGARIVASMAPAGVAPDVARAIVTKAEGIPFFLEELVRALREQGGASRAEIPATIQGVITSRLDRLPPAERDVLEAAAVIGKEGPVALLRETAGLAEADLSSALAQLGAAEFLGEPRAVPVAEYAFTHVLTHEVAYRSLAEDRRRALHGAAAAAIERALPQLAERAPELLAHHLTEAGAMAPAIEQWHRAGRLAIQRSANPEAAHHLARALALIEAQPDDAAREVPVRLALVAALTATRGYAASEVEASLDRARLLVERLPESPTSFVLRWNLWRFYVSRADLRTAEALADRLRAAAEQRADVTAIFNARVAAGVTSFYLGAFAAARAHFDEALRLREAARSPQQIPLYGQDMALAAHGFLGWTRAIAGDLEGARDAVETGLTDARALGHPFSLALALLTAGEVYQLRREPGAVAAVGEELLALSREHSFTFFAAFGTMFVGWARAASGDRAAGVALIREGAEAFRAVGQRLGLAHRAHLAEALIERGALDEGEAVIDEALRQSAATDEGAFAAELHRLLGEALARRGRAIDADASLRRALAIATAQGAWLFAARAAGDLVRVAAIPSTAVADREALAAVSARLAPGPARM